MSKTLLLLATPAVADEGLNLLQTRVAVHSNVTSAHDTDPVNWAHPEVAGHCATTQFVPQEVLDTVLTSSPNRMDFCHCWGDPHCSHVPFDNQDFVKFGTDASALEVNRHHYQYHHNCASTFAKSAPGNPGGPGGRWEIQFSALGGPAGATIWGAAVKVGAFTLEDWHYIFKKFYVNGEEQAPGSPPVHLPSGLHYWHDGNTLCVLQEGQFLWKKRGDYINLLVPKNVQTQGPGTVCYDKSNKKQGDWQPGKPQMGKLMKNAQVVQPGLMAHQRDRWSNFATKVSSMWNTYFKAEADKCNELQTPDANAQIQPSDPASACEKHGFPLTKAEESCGVLKEDHPAFYEDCLIDECMNGDQPEENKENVVELIEKVIEGDQGVDLAVLSEEEACDSVPVFTIKDPVYSNLAGRGPDSDGPKGILYPDAAVINGESVDVLVTAKKFKSFDATKNGAAGGMVSLNMKCGSSATLTITIVDKDKAPVVVPAAAITVLDIDEGKNTKARTTVSSCGALSASAGPELTSGDVPGESGCKVYSSSTHGTAANNPQSLDAITDDHKKRALTFLYGEGSTFEFDVAIGKASKGRNLAFSLSPVLACE